jgi:hypothetical protein
MWEVPKYRVRAYLRSLRESRRRQQEKIRRSSMVFKRARAEVRVSDGFTGQIELYPARVILNDFTHFGLKIFTQKALRPGTEVALTLEEPRYFYIRGKVRWCHDLPFDQRVLTDQPYRHRVWIDFNFSSSAEETAVESYCRQLFRDHLGARYGI